MIMRMPGLGTWRRKEFPLLKVGEHITFEPGGQMYIVERVTFGAAYVRKVFDPPRTVEFTRPDGTVTRIEQRFGPIEPGISPRASIYRIRNEKNKV